MTGERIVRSVDWQKPLRALVRIIFVSQTSTSEREITWLNEMRN